MDIERQIEAVLFYKAEPVKKAALAQFFKIDPEELETALANLAEHLAAHTALRVLQVDNEVQIVTAPELSELIDTVRKDELKRDIGKAGAETLAIIAYRGPASRAEIDKIRGVNSAFILRNLMVRGLIERRENPRDQRSFVYAATPALYAHLGITKKTELPGFDSVMQQLDDFSNTPIEEHSK